MTDQPYVTPLVKKLAAQHGIDLTRVAGSGVGGRIRTADVLGASGAAPVSLAASSAPSVSTVRVLPVAPSNAAEAVAVLGTRPGGDWFVGYPTTAVRAAQADWDAQVSRFATHEDYEAAAARSLMHLGGGKTFEQALGEVRAAGDPGRPGA